ncbi:MAG: type II toxin-antitoxin system death-on-curing family toxin [Nocardioidaceae bacterium]
MSEIEYPDLEDLIGLVRALGAGPIRDIGLLDASTARPRSSAFGEEAYPNVAMKAAALLHSIAHNHALVDGNKRLAWLAAVVFLDLNGYEPAVTDDEAFALVMQVAAGEIDVAPIAQRLKVTPIADG